MTKVQSPQNVADCAFAYDNAKTFFYLGLYINSSPTNKNAVRFCGDKCFYLPFLLCG